MPFATRADAIEFFGGPSLTAEAWVDGLERCDGGWWPRFDVRTMMETLRERIECPTLIVRAGEGLVPTAVAASRRSTGAF